MGANEKIILFNTIHPHFGVGCIDQSKCPESLLAICNVPDSARETLPNMTEGFTDGTEVYVRGVSQTFVGVRVNGEDYYVNSRFLRWM